MMEEQNIFIPPHSLSTAVLFLIFNRLDTTKRVFEAIREAKPPRLYIAADGARDAKEGESGKVKDVRDYVLNKIDWPCEVKTLFQEKNLGCKYAVSSAITWFFENEEMGIILEDDCLPSQSFFWYCEELLERYKNEMIVGQISGDNFQNGFKRGDADYYFSIYNHIWGWASWANRWKSYDVNLISFSNSEFISEQIKDKKISKVWENTFESMKQQKIDTWDYQWTFTLWKNKQLTILPNVNLIKNIGFGEGATHTLVDSEFSNMNNFEIILNQHPKVIVQDKEADNFTSRIMFSRRTIIKKVVNKLKRLMK